MPAPIPEIVGVLAVSATAGMLFCQTIFRLLETMAEEPTDRRGRRRQRRVGG